MRLAILFWFYRDLLVCRNRVRLWRKRNPRVPIYGLYGGPAGDRDRFEGALGPLLDDFWAYPEPRDSRWKWRNGDALLSRWFSERGRHLPWDSVFVAQWDMVAVTPLSRLLPSMEAGEMLLSGLRPVKEVEGWWQWTQGPFRAEYEAFLAHVTARFGQVEDPLCCQFIGVVAPRAFLARYTEIELPELGFLEYKVPIYAQVFGTPLLPDTCFRPWWPEEPGATRARRSECLVHAWPEQLRLPVMAYEAVRPHGRRLFHPYRGVYPHDLASVGELVHHTRAGGHPVHDDATRPSTQF